MMEATIRPPWGHKPPGTTKSRLCTPCVTQIMCKNFAGWKERGRCFKTRHDRLGVLSGQVCNLCIQERLSAESDCPAGRIMFRIYFTMLGFLICLTGDYSLQARRSPPLNLRLRLLRRQQFNIPPCQPQILPHEMEPTEYPLACTTSRPKLICRVSRSHGQ